MKIDGTLLAQNILVRLRREVETLKAQSIVPHLAVIYIGTDAASLSFIKQKEKAAISIGIKLTFHHFSKAPMYQKIAEFIQHLDNDPRVSAIIVQRPLPPSLSAQSLNKLISVKKDVDGFLPKSNFEPPLGIAIFEILNHIRFVHQLQTDQPDTLFTKPFLSWLKTQGIVIIGRGETGGKPIGETLQMHRINFININSKTEEPEEYLRQGSIIISCVGKSNVLKIDQMRQGAILIGVGVHKAKGKLEGDYDESKVEPIASYYTPTPSGVGPVNVACLMANVVKACKIEKTEG